jgi:hypothetical protein
MNFFRILNEFHLKNLFGVLVLFFLLNCERTEESPVGQASLPVLRITTENKLAINSKDVYQKAFLSIEGENEFSDEVEIRGRGNTTWNFQKKPYKIKLKEKTGLLGLESGKKWVLLANYLDPSLMQNAVAMEIGHLLDMPYTNHIVPVDLWINNEYLGNYMFTEQVEVKEIRIDIGEEGILLSLDTIIDADETYFNSTIYKLPVIVKHPEISNSVDLERIEQDFNELERRVYSDDFPNNNYLELFDAEAMAKYLIVYTLTCNEEINHPKSTYIHKKKGHKFTVGPIWDFDWAFSFEQNQIHYTNPTRPLFWEGNAKGTLFFKRIASDPKIKYLIKTQWEDFRSNDFNKLINFVDSYAKNIEASRKADYKKWQKGEEDFNMEKEALKNWLTRRASYLDDLMAGY